jgi:DNA phosphorothioation-dependent restriction protein DptG
VPFCLFSDPEFARIGLTELEAKERGTSCHLVKTDIYFADFSWLSQPFISPVHRRDAALLANRAFTMRLQGHMLPPDPMI